MLKNLLFIDTFQPHAKNVCQYDVLTLISSFCYVFAIKNGKLRKTNESYMSETLLSVEVCQFVGSPHIIMPDVQISDTQSASILYIYNSADALDAKHASILARLARRKLYLYLRSTRQLSSRFKFTTCRNRLCLQRHDHNFFLMHFDQNPCVLQGVPKK